MISRWDRAVVEAFQDAHWHPVDVVFIHLSDWWVKSLVMLAIALAADLYWRRFPWGVALGAIAYLTAEGLSLEMKTWFDRLRPAAADASIHPLVASPRTGSMPSTHAATAFAAAVAISLVHPKLRWPLLLLATLISLSRVWLGVHFLSDVIVGAALGAAIGWAVWWLSRVAGRASRGQLRISA